MRSRSFCHSSCDCACDYKETLFPFVALVPVAEQVFQHPPIMPHDGIGVAGTARKSIRTAVKTAYNFCPESMTRPADDIEVIVESTSRSTKASTKASAKASTDYRKPRTIRTLVLNRPPMGDTELDIVAQVGRKCDFLKFKDIQRVFSISVT